jgi:hypothetical protein
MMSNLKEIWEHQASVARNDVIKQRIEEIQYLNCYAGTISFSKAKFFSIEIDAKVNVHYNYLKRFTGVEVQVLPSFNSNKELVVILLEDELSDVFILFIDDIIKFLLQIETIEDALLIISKRINYWKKLFGKFSDRLLTPEQQRGLFGELYFIKLLLENTDKYDFIINAWQAPAGTNQDFYFNGKAVEVKTSKANDPNITITNEFQLDTRGLDQLYIAFFKLIEYPANDNTLLIIISGIRNLLKINQNLISEFNAKLETLGITSDIEEEYNKTSYNIRNEIYYKVTDDFPKITSLLVHEAISKITYQITPAFCKNYIVESDFILKELLNG